MTDEAAKKILAEVFGYDLYEEHSPSASEVAEADRILNLPVEEIRKELQEMGVDIPAARRRWEAFLDQITEDFDGNG